MLGEKAVLLIFFQASKLIKAVVEQLIGIANWLTVLPYNDALQEKIPIQLSLFLFFLLILRENGFLEFLILYSSSEYSRKKNHSSLSQAFRQVFPRALGAQRKIGGKFFSKFQLFWFPAQTTFLPAAKPSGPRTVRVVVVVVVVVVGGSSLMTNFRISCFPVLPL